MLWIVFALAGALSQATYTLSVKLLLRRESPYTLAGISFLSASLLLLAVSLLRGIPTTGPGLFRAVAVTVTINIIATILLYRALASTDLSLTVPMLAFTPVFLILTSFLILGELPSTAGAAGIMMVACGAYLLNLEYVGRKPAALSAPFRSLRRDRGIQSMLVVSFLFSISVNFDKQVVENSDTVFGSVIVFFLLGCSFLAITLIASRRTGGDPLPGGSSRQETRGSASRRTDKAARHQDWNSGDPVSGKGILHHVEMDDQNPGRDHVSGLHPGDSRDSPLQEDGNDPPPKTTRHVPAIVGFLLVGLVLSIEIVSINTAYTMSIVPYVITIKRLAIFFSVLYGGLLLHERQLGGRILGAVVMIAGAAVIALMG